MPKLLALDVGTKRIGLAVADVALAIAFPRGCIARNPKEVSLRYLRELTQAESVERLVVGVPLGEDNEETDRSKDIRKFAGNVGAKLKLPVSFVDEFGTTREALGRIPLKRDRKAKGADDAIAAQIILERYLAGR